MSENKATERETHNAQADPMYRSCMKDEKRVLAFVRIHTIMYIIVLAVLADFYVNADISYSVDLVNEDKVTQIYSTSRGMLT